MAIHPEGMECSTIDGVALNGATGICHSAEVLIFASPERRRLIDFGLGPGPTPWTETAESAAVLRCSREGMKQRRHCIGVVWEAQLGQPARLVPRSELARGPRSFSRCHFTAVLARCCGAGARLRRPADR
jgi:hypothetical protein